MMEGVWSPSQEKFHLVVIGVIQAAISGCLLGNGPPLILVFIVIIIPIRP